MVRRCRRQRRQGGAGGGRTARSARLSIRKDDHASGAALGAAVVHAVLDLRVTRQAHKVYKYRLKTLYGKTVFDAAVKVRQAM